MSDLAFPKPARRSPKPKRPIARTSRPARVRRTPAGRAKASLNALWSKVIMSRRPRKPLCLVPHIPGVMCLLFATDPAHLYPKSTHPSIRHHPKNGIPACRPCHDFLDSHGEFRNRVAETMAPGLRAESFKPSPDRDEARRILTDALKTFGGRS